MLDYRIETFITLCRERNYSKTAQILCITQPAVTQHIQYLERHYGCKLFEYENKQLKLTEQGRILERMALGLSASTKRVKTLIHESKINSKVFKIGVSITACEQMLPSIVSQLYQLSPVVNLNISVQSSAQLINGLKNGQFEAILIEGSYDKGEFEHQLFTREEYIGVSKKKYDTANIGEILDENIICRENGSGVFKLLEDNLSSKGYTIHDFNNVIQVNNLHLIKELVKRGTGIALLPKDSVIEELLKGELHYIETQAPLFLEYNYITLKNLMFTKNYQDFYDFAKDIYEKEKEQKMQL